VTPDGFGVNLCVFARENETGKWDLGTDVQLDLPQHHDEFRLTHLSWSHLGNDLAVVNEAGHVMIFSCAMVLDRMNFMRTELSQSDSEGDGVVGMHWLAIYPYEQKVLSLPCTECSHADRRRITLLGRLARETKSGTSTSLRTFLMTCIMLLTKKLACCI
jgi:hypothetical protein